MTERTAIVPHISWNGPQPDNQLEAYALAIIVRIAAIGTKKKNRESVPPTALTTNGIRRMAGLYAMYKDHIREDRITSSERLLAMIRETEQVDIRDWVAANTDKVEAAIAELIEYVETAEHPGFRCYG